MSKLKELSKNIWVRVSTLVTVLAIGSLAIMQSTGIAPPTASVAETAETTPAVPANGGIGILPDPEGGGDFSPRVVRGNDNDFSLPPTGGAFAKPPTENVSDPPAQTDFSIPESNSFEVPAAAAGDNAFSPPPSFDAASLPANDSNDSSFALPPIAEPPAGDFTIPESNASVATTASPAAPPATTPPPATIPPPVATPPATATPPVASQTPVETPPTFNFADAPAAVVTTPPASVPPPVAAEPPQTLPTSGNEPDIADVIPTATPPAAAPSFDPAPTRFASTTSNEQNGAPAGASGNATPGDQSLDGPQSPSLSIVKLAPQEIQVGKPAIFEIRVQNAGSVTAHDVAVVDRIPRGVKLMETNPPAQLGANGELKWTLGEIKPGAQQTVSVQYLPLEEGEVGSVAVVTASTVASVRTVCTRPLLEVEQVGPARVLLGDSVNVLIRISNPGTGAAYNVILEENVPAQLTHPAGGELEYEVGTLKPGETRELELVMQAAQAGKLSNDLVVRGEGSLVARHALPMEVIAPQLKASIDGPTVRYLQREAAYQINIANPGTASARDVDLTARLPRGLKFISANNAGQYDAREHTVRWSLVELPAGQSGAVEVRVLPIEVSAQKIRVEGAAQLNVADVVEHTVAVKAVSELFFEVTDEADPIEVGSDTIYTIRIVNHGAAAAQNVVVDATFPNQLKPTGGEGPSRFAMQGNRLVFEPLAQIAPKGEVTFRVKASGVAAGDHKVRVSVSSASSAAVGKEENTRVYSDQ